MKRAQRARQRADVPWTCIRLEPQDVPRLPDGAEPFATSYGDVVYDVGNHRWRYRDGKLKAYFEYVMPRPEAGCPWAKMWTDGR